MASTRQTFSQRGGYAPVPTVAQRETMSVELRNSLWNVLTLVYWQNESFFETDRPTTDNSSQLGTLLRRLWIGLFKQPVDRIGWMPATALDQVRKLFFECPWHQAYDMVEWFVQNDEAVRLEFFFNNV